jgi:hypothetical protein
MRYALGRVAAPWPGVFRGAGARLSPPAPKGAILIEGRFTLADIFLSYAKSTARAVRPIAKALTAEGFDVWWDEELPVHRSYSEVIQEQIGAAKAVVVVWSGDAAKSVWVRSEANEGREAGKLVQILIDGAALPMPFNQIQFADLGGWRGDRTHPQWRKVVQSLAEIVDRPAQAAKPVTAAPTLADRLRGVRPAHWAMAALSAVVLVAMISWMTVGRTRATASAAATSAALPSFRCADAGSQTERYICAEPAVAAAELDMSNAYHAAMARTHDKATLMSSQRDFLINLTAAPHNRQTFIRLYAARTAALKTLSDPK